MPFCGCPSAIPVDKRWRLSGQGWLARQEQDDAEPVRVVCDGPAPVRLVDALVLRSMAGEPSFGHVELRRAGHVPPDAGDPDVAQARLDACGNLTDDQPWRGFICTAEHREHVVVPGNL